MNLLTGCHLEILGAEPVKKSPCMKVSKFGCVQILMNKKLSEIEMTFCNANNFRSQPEFREISLVERYLASRRTKVSRGLNVPSKFQNFIQLLESPIPTTTTSPATTTSQKESSGDILGTKRGIIDPLMSKCPIFKKNPTCHKRKVEQVVKV